MKLKTTLYEHQQKAFDKLSKIKVGALYMEMGTGKTRVALELIKLRLDGSKVNHVLWLCPCSAKASLKRERKKHAAGDLSMFTICGIETLSSSIRANVILRKLVKEKQVYLIVDESNLIKNHKAKRTENIVALSSSCDYKLILNGTPITRNEKDLFSQWLVLDWRILGYRSFWSFAANHLEYDETGRIRRSLNTNYLTSKIAPYTYQVTKDECLDLPLKSYGTIYCDMTQEQWYHYQDVADSLLFEVDEMDPHTIYRLFTGLQNVISGLYVSVGERLNTRPFFDNPADNPRIQRLMDILDNTKKTIIFCKYTHEIKAIKELINKEYGPGAAVEFYGGLAQRKRQENLKKFEKESNFLVANKTCAGYSLNLQFCSYVIYYSNDWDYATRSQSEDRVHRMGQTKNVHYIDICCDNSLDVKILKCLNRKEDLIDSFKRELEETKDIDVVKKYIYYKDYKGRTKVSDVKNVKIETLNDLSEVV